MPSPNSPLLPGRYVAQCKETHVLQAAANGHSLVFPESECVVRGTVAKFYKDGVLVWSCNTTYAQAHFVLTRAK